MSLVVDFGNSKSSPTASSPFAAVMLHLLVRSMRLLQKEENTMLPAPRKGCESHLPWGLSHTSSVV